ncbi:LysR family transcriptional regulator [Acetobacter orientalis]|uniref:LysR family transcriptional regulator n=1 Tax=Acetobacter orientalis TaxID=146474 RepID=A0A2Z5ZEF5_9PROT|nr:LysR family transcriptional regulator [Acetobacter orientalis]BBC78775.1 LysR family transcriptional regulator [Acetobacter orientalis]GAN66858.1 transcriptional regulator LysR [Acetobacter orientalis]GBR14447.1 LysR family transcriptional regulator [Acetobacter orientalis NRIC 0481]GEL60897.1 LysR family transcriptional regulator [Acetobacter orientalis]
MRLPDFEAWAIFAKVAEFGSFSRAAEDVQLSKPTVSKAINRLEQSLGVSLFSRNSRHLSLTETGRALLGYANKIVLEAQAAEAEARGNLQRPSGRVRVAAPMTFGISHLAPLLPDFMQRYPEIELNISFNDATIDLVADGFDIALRISSLADSSLRAKKICDVRLLLVAAPIWFATAGNLTHPRDLAGHKGFVYTHNTGPGIIRLRQRGSGKEFTLTQKASLLADNAEAFMPALAQGLGYGLFPDFMVRTDLNNGHLQQILPEWEGALIGVYLLTPPSSIRPSRVTALLEYLMQAFERPPWAEK